MDNFIMTKYEYTRIRGIRLQQLIDGIPPFVQVDTNDTNERIFDKELLEGKLPFTVRRPTGLNKYVDIPVSKLDTSKFLENIEDRV